MGQMIKSIADVGAVGVGALLSPLLRFLGQKRMVLPRFQKFSDRAGFHILSGHYYEPTYNEHDLPKITTIERSLPGLDLNEAGQLQLLSAFTFADELADVPLNKPSACEFGHVNQMYSYADAELYYNMIRLKKPRRIIEIGSGNSTLMALRAIAANMRDDPAYDCDICCIEPYEMPWLESTGVRVIRERIETLDLEIFDALNAGDILFIDSSHVIRPWGDVLREFQEIVPRLASGVLIHVHDIFTPHDYPEKWLRQDRRLWNEQYLLESFLAFNSRFKVICAANWLKHHHFDALGKACPIAAQHPEHEPGAFWFAAV
jgi:predicted O-methyltransferase YrrM